MKNTISGIKNTLEGSISRPDETKDHINNLEDMVAENSQSSKNKKEYCSHSPLYTILLCDYI